ncbi:hypothetical protein OSTOST_05218 [Ostertagia ostertagi]
MQSDAARIAGCHQTTVGDALFAFVRALNRRAGQFIFWPREGEKIEIRRKFYTKFGLPGVTGVIDGTHCRIQRPTEGEEETMYSPSKAAEIVVTCCVLRNIAIGANEPSDYDEYSGELRQDGEVPSEPSTEAPEPSAISFMRDIIERYF